MYFLVNPSPPKPLDVAASIVAGAHMSLPGATLCDKILFYHICDKRRLGRGCASVDSHYRLLCSHTQLNDPTIYYISSSTGLLRMLIVLKLRYGGKDTNLSRH